MLRQDRMREPVTPKIAPRFAPWVTPRFAPNPTFAPIQVISMCRKRLVFIHLFYNQSVKSGSKRGSAVGVNGLRPLDAH